MPRFGDRLIRMRESEFPLSEAKRERAIVTGATPEDVAGTVAFPSSPAGAYTNGVMYMLEGGATAGYFSA